jgi:HSP20 family molecular chaperone IbpA
MLVRTRPYRPAFTFDRSLDRTFDQLTSSFFTNVKRTPIVDASWHDGSLVLAVDVPGTPSEQVGVAVSGRTLTISVTGEGSTWERSLRLGAALDAEQVSATYVDGRLTVTVAAAAQPAARTIEISTSAPAAIEVAETPADVAPEASADAQPENGTSESA